MNGEGEGEGKGGGEAKAIADGTRGKGGSNAWGR